MASHYRLLEPRYLLPTPAGAYQAVSTGNPGPVRRFLFQLMRETSSQRADTAALVSWTQDSEEGALTLLNQLQSLHWVEGEQHPRHLPEGSLEDVLPQLLEPLSSSGRTLLADNQGLYVASSGYTHETAEELAALSASLANLHQHHDRLLNHNLGLRGQAWSLCDAQGNSQIGFWPLFVGQIMFVLAISDMPMFNQPVFRDLVWTLSRRYAVVQ